MNMIEQRLHSLRELMQREHLQAFIFPSTDPHQGEYVPDHWKGRQYISGFNGSAGTAVVTMQSAALWTYSRYFLAAEKQLAGTEFQLMKQKTDGTPTISQWLGQELKDDYRKEVGIDGMVSSAAVVKTLIADLRREGGITLRTNLDPLAMIWTDRPAIPAFPLEIHPLEYAGESTQEKLARIRKALREQHADGMLMAALDDIAWTLNLRGSDVHCNPVFVSYLLISTRNATLYIDKNKLSDKVKDYLTAVGVKTDDYQNVGKGLKDYFEYNILLDPNEVNYTLYKQVSCRTIEEESPVRRMKAIKNNTETAGFRKAMERDGVAMVRLLMWNEQKAKDSAITELDVCQQLEHLRRQQANYRGPSFDTIAAYGPHGAIVHYEPTPESNATLKPEGLLLLDSGGQYLEGTTDITRTIAQGPLTDEMKRVYTLVLKGHLQLQNLHFPDGASGTQLDAVARMAMWRHGYNYLHGTGHGVGNYLNVHEGPQQIRMEYMPAPLRAGMTVTDEPGIYLANRFGVRIENTLLIVPDQETECGRFLRFEPLTLCPIDKRPIVADMLTNDERQWLDDYHKVVRQRLWPLLTGDEQQWLLKATAPINSKQ